MQKERGEAREARMLLLALLLIALCAWALATRSDARAAYPDAVFVSGVGVASVPGDNAPSARILTAAFVSRDGSECVPEEGLPRTGASANGLEFAPAGNVPSARILTAAFVSRDGRAGEGGTRLGG